MAALMPQVSTIPLHDESAPPTKRQSVRSLDDHDINIMRSRSSFGWYDEGCCETDDLQSTFVQIDNWREINAKSLQPSTDEYSSSSGGSTAELSSRSSRTLTDDLASDSAHSNGDAAVELEERSDMTFTTRTFRRPDGKSVPYAVAIRAFRVINSGGGHAQYQLVLSTPERLWKCWKRFSDFKLLAEYAKISDLTASVDAWSEITNTQRWFRCLEASYLRTKCAFLERFMAQLLFELPSPSLLLTFVQAPRDLLEESRDSR